MSEEKQANHQLPAVPETKIKELETVVKNCGLATLDQLGSFERAFRLAGGMQQLRQLITNDMLANVMQLQNTALGFLTDAEAGYPAAIVKECLIEATIRGVAPIGNEFNIIARRCYITKNGFSRLLREFPGLTDLKKTFGVPVLVGEGGAKVAVSATWKINGQAQQLDERTLPIRVNKAMGADAVLGKADRKLMAAIYAQITGSEQTEGEVGDDLGTMRDITPKTAEEEPQGSRADALARRLAPKQGKAAEAPVATPTRTAEPPQGETKQEEKREEAKEPPVDTEVEALRTQIVELCDEMDSLLHAGAGVEAVKLKTKDADLKQAGKQYLAGVVEYLQQAILQATPKPAEPPAQAKRRNLFDK